MCSYTAFTEPKNVTFVWSYLKHKESFALLFSTNFLGGQNFNEMVFYM